MTDQEINLAIAEACGWREAFPQSGQPHPETKRGGILLPYTWVNEITHKRSVELPDYLNDLNAMREAEKVLGNGRLEKYEIELAKLVRQREIEWIGGKSESFDTAERWVFHATARQRAEAFLETIKRPVKLHSGPIRYEKRTLD